MQAIMQSHDRKIVLSTPNHFYIIEVDDIVFCQQTNAKTTVSLQSGEQLSIDIPIEGIRKKINRADFFQPQDNCLVNGQYVSKLQRIEGPEILLDNGRVFSISPERKQEIKHFLEKITRIQI
nr:LytTR family transcriptional regulator DNA-binding domain-containing protein [uncultured Draconibacterium sp.]